MTEYVGNKKRRATAPPATPSRTRPQVKLPFAPTFDGIDPTPRSVNAWLSSIELYWNQLNLDDPVLWALHHLRGDAIIWREQYLKAQFSGTLLHIPVEEFKRVFRDRFIPLGVSLKAEKAFHTMEQRSTVEAYNAHFLMARDELLMLPHISAPDVTTQTKVYWKGLKASVKQDVKPKLTKAHVNDLLLLMSVAAETEHVTDSMDILGDLFGSKTTQGNKPSGGQGNGDGKHKGKPWGKHKQKHDASAGAANDKPDSTISNSGRSNDNAVKRQKNGKNGNGKAKTDWAALRAAADDSALAGPDGQRYPNDAWRAVNGNANKTQGKCFFCGNKHEIAAGMPKAQWHRKDACPSPLVRQFHVDPYLWHGDDGQVYHIDDIAPSEEAPVNACNHTSGQCDATCSGYELEAAMAATPYKGLTMLFSGAAKPAGGTLNEQKALRVLIDSGSSHNFISEEFAGLAEPSGRQFSVTCADNSRAANVPEAAVRLEVDDYSAELQMLVMTLPSGIDAILGDQWAKQNKAALLWEQEMCRIVDMNTSTEHYLVVPRDMSADPYNKPDVKCWVSAAGLDNSVEASWLVFVQENGAMSMSAVAAVEASLASGGQGSALDAVIEDQAMAGELKRVLQEYRDIFPEQLPSGLPPDRPVAHTIPLKPNSVPPAKKMHRLSKREEDEMLRQIRQLLELGWIQPSSSPYGSPILFVRKKDGSLRMCIDYRGVNKITVRNSYPLPRIDDMFDKLAGAKYFSCLDLQSAYHQVKLSEHDVPKTAFTTPMGLYEYRVLPFGLTNAPATFQSLMNQVLGPYLSKFCLVYLDDVLVFSRTPEEHTEHLRLVLAKLREHKLFAKLSKCRFALSSVHFLGHVISAAGIQPDPAKVAIVRDWPTPRNVHELRKFVGLAQYFRKFIQGFASMLAPLTALFKKNAAWIWTSKCKQAFEQIKLALTSAPVLKLPDDDSEFEIICDASGVGLGAVLLQNNRPVAFDGRKLTDVEQKWPPTEQEMLAVVHHLHKWRCYLDGRHFTVVTDHKPNTWFNEQKTLNPRQHCWYEHLRSFDFDWQYRPGRTNVADPLSRHPAFLHYICAVSTRSQAAVLPSMLREQLHQDKLSASEASGPSAKRRKGMSGKPVQDRGTNQAGKQSGSTAPANPSAGEVQAGAQTDRAADLPINQSAELPFAAVPIPNHAFNADAAKVLQQCKDGYAADAYFSSDHERDRQQAGLTYEADGLWLKGQAVVVPAIPELRRNIVRELHCSPYAGHFGVHRTERLISRYFWWPRMHDDIASFVGGCVICQRSKSVAGPKAGKLMPLPVPEGIWEDITMDFVGPLPLTARGHDFLLVVVDRLSKMARFLACRSNIDAQGVAELFVHRIYALHGLPKSIVTDRGTQFLNEWNTTLLRLLGTKHFCSTAFHPETDGQTERVNRILLEMLRHYTNARQDDWDMHLPLVEFAHNNAYSSVTGSTPFFVCYGKHPRTPMSMAVDRDQSLRKQFPSVSKFVAERQEIVRLARAAMESARQRMEVQANLNRRDLVFAEGNLVSLKTKHLGINTLPSRKLFPKYLGPFRVHKVVNKNAYQLELPRHWRAHNVFHVSLLRPYVSNGEAVDPLPFTLVGGQENEWELESILDFRPKTLKKSGVPRKVKELEYFCKWLGQEEGIDAWQPYKNLAGSCDESLRLLAERWRLPSDLFLAPDNLLPASASAAEP